MIGAVLSDSTERTDRSEKWLADRSLDSLLIYVVVLQKRKKVIVPWRETIWKLEQFTGDDLEIQLSCVSVPVTSELIYRGVEFGDPE